MGAWGTGSFENDAAMDWAAQVQGADHVRAPFERLKRETDANPDGGEMYLEADFASQLVAAAECVAMMMGRIVPGFPDDLRERLSVASEPDAPEPDAPEPDALLFHQARNALLSVVRHSELAELWDESSEEEGTNQWLVETSLLVERLNPDIDYVQILPEVDELDLVEEEPVCAFCRKPIPEGEFFGMSVTEYGDIFDSSRILPIHLPCLNARLHKDSAVLAFRDDPTRPIDLDKL